MKLDVRAAGCWNRVLCYMAGVILWSQLAPNLFAAEEHPLPKTVSPGAKLVELYADPRFFEGPVWDPATKKLYFTAFGENRSSQIMRSDEPGKASVWMDKTEGVNGTYLAKDGRMLGAQAFGHRVLSLGMGPDGPSDVKVLVHNPRLNQPNDIAQAPNGDIYFTDPDFGKRLKSGVFHLSAQGVVTQIIHDMPTPNGLIVSNDGQTLYVGDSHLKLWRSYPIQTDGSVGPGRVYFDPATERRDDPDGMSIDEAGNLYLSGRGGVWVASPGGDSLGLIPVPEFCSNVTFGGEDGKTLYLTCSKKVYSLSMTVRGGPYAWKK